MAKVLPPWDRNQPQARGWKRHDYRIKERNSERTGLPRREKTCYLCRNGASDTHTPASKAGASLAQGSSNMPASSRRAALLVVLVILSCGFLGALFGQRLRTAQGVDPDVRDSLQRFTHVYDLVEQNYAEPVSPDKAVYNGAIPGMLRTLDPHSSFFDPRAYSLLQEDQ